MNLKKKILVVFCLIALGGSFLLFSKNTTLVRADSPPPEEEIVVKFGMLAYSLVLDPLNIISYDDLHIISPVVETLFAENASDPNLGLIPCLASDFGTWSLDKLSYTVSIKSDVVFHDDTPVDASAIKWNFDRLAFFMNITGENPVTTPFDYLYRWDDGTPIINRTEVINAQTVRFVLNKVYAAFDSLLSTIVGAGILSPSSSPEHSYLSFGDPLIGTGPYKIDTYNYAELDYSAFSDYHAGMASIDKLIGKIYDNSDTLHNAFIDGEVDINVDASTANLDFYRQHFDFDVLDIDTSIAYYLGMNNAHINKTMRQAISYAINYTKLMEPYEDSFIRLKSPVAKPVRYSNWTYDIAILNIIKAREILVDSGICNFDIYDDNVWITAAESLNPVVQFNFTQYSPGGFAHELAIRVHEDLKQIGIKIDILGPIPWPDYQEIVFDPANHYLVDLFFTGWGVDYNDPSSALDELFMSTSENNCMVNDTYLDSLLDMGLQETNPTAREAIYDTIQQYMVEDLMPCGFLFSPINHIAYSTSISNIKWNSYGVIDFYSASAIQKIIKTPVIMKFGFLTDFTEADPIQIYWAHNVLIASQFIETLLRHNLTDPNLGIIPCLASDLGEWSDDGLNYTISLKQDVKFHDGTAFDAYAVKWNFDRRAYFMNLTGELPSSTPPLPSNSLFVFEDGTPVINRTEVINPLTVRFVLNSRFVPFESLLTFIGTGILSPSSTPQHTLVSVYDNIYATGPFLYEETADLELKFHAFKQYHSGLSNIDTLRGIIYYDREDLVNAYFSGEIDFCLNLRGSDVEAFVDDENTVIQSSPQQTTYYIGMNTNHINKTMRQAISYGVNYTEQLELVGGELGAARLKSPYPVPSLYASWDFDAAIYNVTKAREILIDAGICDFDINNDEEWTSAAQNNPIASYNYTCVEGALQEIFGTNMIDDLARIGINLTVTFVDSQAWIYKIINLEPYSRDELDLYFMGWGMDYNDPSNFNALFLSSGFYNGFGLNDPYIDSLLSQGISETNRTIREQLYMDFQEYVVEDLMPCLFIFSPIVHVAYSKNFTGFQWNSQNVVRFIDVSLIVEVDTPEGANIEIYDEYHALNLTFQNISTGGTTIVVSSNTGVDPEDGFGLAGEYYEIDTTAEFTGTVIICLEYDEEEIRVNENDLRLMHWDDELEEWTDITTYVDTVNNLVYGETTSFSVFSIVQPDHAPPTTEITINGEEGLDNWFTSNVYIVLSAKDLLSDVSLTEYSFDGTTWIEYTKLFAFKTPGITQIYYRSMDVYGNMEEIQTYEIKIDKEAPSSSISLEGEMGMNGWYTSAVEFTIDAIDDYSGLYKIEFSTDGINWNDFYTSEIIFEEEINTVFYRAVDFAGNVEEVQFTSFQIDTTLPVGSMGITGTLGDNNWYISNVIVSITGSDVTSGISTIEYGFDGETWYTYSGELEITEQGETTLFFRVVDNAGLIFSTSTTISIDYTPPVSELFITDGYTNEEETIFVVNESTFIVVGLDNESLAINSYYSIDGSEWAEFTDAFNLSDYEYGTHVISYYSVDLAGNVGPTQSTFVEFVEEIGDTYVGWGMLVVDGDRLKGDATLTITETTITMEIEDVIAEWDITETWELKNIEFIFGDGEIGWIKVLVFTRGDTTYIIAVGKDVFFMGSSTT